MTTQKLALFSLAALFGLMFQTAAIAATQDNAATGKSSGQKAGEPVFAMVGNTVITQREYDNAFAMASRQKFYHGKPPEAEVAALQRTVGNNLVNSVLLAAEARKRGIKPDKAAVKLMIDNLEQRYKDSEQWQKESKKLIPEITRKLEDDSVIKQLELAVRNVPVPSVEQVRTYYERNADKFTEPEQVHIGLILLKVDPSSPKAVWDKAQEEGQGIVRQIKGGASFADMAKLRSSDSSAENGGDMGYLHRGMLPEAAQSAIDKMKVGEVSDPIFLLEGVAIFRLIERKAPHKVSFADAQERATKLLTRELSEQAWTDLIERLRKEAKVQIDESRYLPLKTASGPK